jgi:hypothetical protein
MTVKTRKYVCMWDCDGFEVLADVSSWERQCLIDTLSGKEISSAPVNLHAMIMRATFNPQRNPEIWTFEADSSMDQTILTQCARNNPAYLADVIRQNGQCLYSNATQKYTAS